MLYQSINNKTTHSSCNNHKNNTFKFILLLCGHIYTFTVTTSLNQLLICNLYNTKHLNTL